MPAGLDAPEEVHTPGLTTVEQVAGALGGAGRRAAEGLSRSSSARSELRMVVVRGDHRVNDIKLTNALGRAVPARAGRGDRARRSGRRASSARSARSVPVLLDRAIAEQGGGGWVAGGGKPDVHLRGVEIGRDFPFERRRRAQRRGGRHGRRPRDPDRARDRGRQHLQARHALLGAARRHVPGRERQGADDLDGLLRHRPGADRRRGDRAERRREGHLVAARAGAVAGPPRQRRQGRARPSARPPTRSTRRCAAAASRSSTTNATPARARSSPTPSCSACRCG